MKQYLDLVSDIMANGVDKSDRTGTGTRSVFGRQMRFDLAQGFPLLTTKKLHFKSIAIELLWLISGSTNIQFMKDNNVTIWDEWADEFGELGPVYGKQWRRWQSFEPDHPDDEDCYGRSQTYDQLAQVIERIKVNPDCRRLIVSAWNVGDIHKMKLPPCHAFFQFYVANGKLSCQMYQRSADTFLGVPYNIASYSLLTHMVAHLTDLEVGEFVHSLGDAHIYKNHFDAIRLQVVREPRPLPHLRIKRKVESIDDFKYEDFEIVGYNPHPAIKGEVSV